MTIVNTHEAKTHLSELLRRAAAGEEIVIARGGTPVARLVAVPPPAAGTPEPPKFGTLSGTLILRPGWDDPLSDDELTDWYGSPLPAVEEHAG